MRWQWSGILVQILLHAASKLAQYVDEDRAASGTARHSGSWSFSTMSYRTIWGWGECML